MTKIFIYFILNRNQAEKKYKFTILYFLTIRYSSEMIAP